MKNMKRRNYYIHHFSFVKKDNIIRNIEFIIALTVAGIMAAGLYTIL
ncbi:hypothetical protein [Flavobacterium sp. MK4S-17]|jgi:hypothetical protein|nr:hypothetical protein [Flavobacterium sp. MK4S-17]